jgi:hypothetical protein
MPYLVKKQGSKWVVYNPNNGHVYGTHDTEAGAKAQAAALYAATGGRAAIREDE